MGAHAETEKGADRLKPIGYFASFLGGAVITSIAAHFYWKKKNLKEVDQVRVELKEWYKERLEKDTAEEIAKAKDAVEEERKNREAIVKDKVEKKLDEMLRDTPPEEESVLSKREQRIRELKKQHEAAKRMEEKRNEASRRVQKETRYIIRPDEYGERPDYGRYSYTYYEGNERYVNSDFNVPVEEEEILDMIGPDIPEHFGEFEDDAVYVRNEDLKTDIAVYLAEGSFDDE